MKPFLYVIWVEKTAEETAETKTKSHVVTFGVVIGKDSDSAKTAAILENANALKDIDSSEVRVDARPF